MYALDKLSARDVIRLSDGLAVLICQIEQAHPDVFKVRREEYEALKTLRSRLETLQSR